MNSPEKKEQLKQQNRIKFILAAREILESDEAHNLSVRSIAQKAGFHNSTIYLYFEDLDRLISLASLKYFTDYYKRLMDMSNEELPDEGYFFSVWELFCFYSFQHAKAFNFFFFGKHKNSLTEIIEDYYSLFPDERMELGNKTIRDMYYGNTIYERCRTLMEPLIGNPKFSVTENNNSVIIDLTVSYYRSLLNLKLENPDLDNDELCSRFLKAVSYLVTKDI